VEGVSNLVLPAGTPSLFTELNEFDEGCSAIKSLAVRVCLFFLLRFPLRPPPFFLRLTINLLFFWPAPIFHLDSCGTVRRSEPYGPVLTVLRAIFGPRTTK
jgi:hypothetical protein